MQPTALLITQCLQHDFVGPIGSFQSLPNLLHVGVHESRRMNGEDGLDGPLQRFMEWAYTECRNQLAMVHLRDWHDSSDPRQQQHLAKFGPHCLRHSPGADFVFQYSGDSREPTHIVDSLGLNDFQDTRLAAVLEPWAAIPLRVGIIGVWTEAKVTFLAYELTSRYPAWRIGVCSALTAGSTRQRHFLAIQQLSNILGVEVFSSVGSFESFLCGSVAALDPVPSGAQIDDASLSVVDEKLANYLFRNSRNVTLHKLAGGFSGSSVLKASSNDMYGHEEATHVLKIGNMEAIAKEREAFEQIESVLGNWAPRIVDFADLENRGALKYRYASMGKGDPVTFKKLYERGESSERLKEILARVFNEQLARLYDAAQEEPTNLIRYYGFAQSQAAYVRKAVEKIGLTRTAEGRLLFPWGKAAGGVDQFYDGLDSMPVRPADQTFFSYVHGDLNTANILVDTSQNVWLIDFFHAHYGHVLRDLLKLENDLQFILCQVQSPEELAQASRVSELLASLEDLAAPLPSASKLQLTSSALIHAYEMISFLRSMYPRLVRSDRNPLQALIGSLRYAVHTLSFDESSAIQKTWALYYACLLGSRIESTLRRESSLEVHWLNDAPQGRLGLTLLPGRKDFGRELSSDIQALIAQGVTHVVTLVTPDELETYGVSDLLQQLQLNGLTSINHPILDQHVCTPTEMAMLVEQLDKLLNQGARIAVHCLGGLGRSGTVAACYLRLLGMNPDQALDSVRKSRSPRAIESKVQEEFVRSFAPIVS